jgi:hypothetical protein
MGYANGFVVGGNAADLITDSDVLGGIGDASKNQRHARQHGFDINIVNKIENLGSRDSGDNSAILHDAVGTILPSES